PKQEVKPEPKQEVKPEPKQEAKPARSAAEDALDRDLERTRQRRMKEQAYEEKQKKIEAQKEAERQEKARHAKERAVNAAASAAEKAAAQKKAEEVKQAAEAPKAAAKTKAKKKKNTVARDMNLMAAGRAAAVLAAVLIVGYGGAFIYTSTGNESYLEDLDSKLTGQSRLVDDPGMEYEISPLSQLSYDEKVAQGLSVGLKDSDKDGLSDYFEINNSNTDPLNPDTDGDGMNDGDEIIEGFDPNDPSDSSESADDSLSVSDGTVEVVLTGSPKTADVSFVPCTNKSIQGTPGVIGTAYEFYSDSEFTSARLTFAYTDAEIAALKTPAEAISIFRFNNDTLSFDKVASTVDPENHIVYADVDDTGIYTAGDTSVIMKESNTQIFFLIDNSGSMYPEELCAGSEENDVEFKRLDFTMDLIDKLKEEAKFGAAEFSGNFTLISPISDNSDEVRSKVDSIRSKKQTFSGTDIAGSIINAANEFDAASLYDKNYIVLLTDGMPSVPNTALDQRAVELAKSKNITIFTIGLGKYIDAQYLFDIADGTNGQFFQASNADALESIYEKIRSFMSYNQVVIEEESGKKGFLAADCGFNASKDGLAYSNFRTDFAPNGADFAIAGIIRAYYRGELPLKTADYDIKDGTTVMGYDVSGIEQFVDGKKDLCELQLGILDTYNSYLALENKWNYSSIHGGVLNYRNETRDFINEHSMNVMITDYKGTLQEDSGFISFLRKITFHSLPQFDKYETALINSNACTGDEQEVMNMFRYYNYLPKAAGKVREYDFGYDGEDAVQALIDELTTGNPAVISFGGSAMNAVRLIRDADNPNCFVLEAYDSNSPGRLTQIVLNKTAVHDGIPNSHSYQYAAVRNGTEQPLKLYIY
ncbi:MAG: VWA domain-containing protein, partial [Huintestinicola sp.]